MDQAGASPLAGATSTTGGYPLRLILDPAKTSMNRLWGIPLLGILARGILAIPAFVILAVLGFLTYFVTFVSWIPVLFTGRQAGWIYAVIGSYLDWAWRTTTYVYLLVGGHPLSGDFGARVELDRTQHFNQLWGIPVIGLLIRWFVLIPHFIVLGILGIVAGFLLLVSWIPVLAYGRQADVIVRLMGGFYRWYLRVVAYLLLVASPYPPFSLD
jgi:hypothetical protein